jgi:hypothetical protein
MSWRRRESLSARGAEGIPSKVEVLRNWVKCVGWTIVFGSSLLLLKRARESDNEWLVENTERAIDVYKL